MKGRIKPCLFAFFLVTFLQTFGQSACLEEWGYIRNIAVDNLEPSPFTNLPVLLVLNSDSLDRMAADGSDLRFVDGNNCCNELDYWIQSGIGTTEMRVWINVPSLPASGSANIIMYYGKTGAPAPARSDISLMDSVGNDAIGSVVIEGENRTFNTHRFTGLPTTDSVITVRWRFHHSTPIDSLTLKSTDSDDIIRYSLGLFNCPAPGAVPVYSMIDAEIQIPPGGRPGFHSPNELQVWAPTSCGTCKGKWGVGNIFLGALPEDFSLAQPALKIWYRQDPGTEPEVYFVSGEIRRAFTVPILPNEPQDICNGETVTFEALGDFVSFEWYRNDTLIPGANTGSYTTDVAGNYRVLAGLSNCDKKSSLTVSVGISPDPVIASIQYDPDSITCQFQELEFSFTQAPPVEVIDMVEWTFGETETDVGEVVSHAFSNVGAVSVELILTSDVGCKDTMNQSIVIHEKPEASFSVENICLGDSARFLNTSEFSGVLDSATHQWNFGDGFGVFGANPVRGKYGTAGTYDVSYIIVTDQYCRDTATGSLEVFSNPTSGFEVEYDCPPGNVSFTCTSIGTLSAHAWYFGDGGSAVESNPDHFYENPGSYLVQLIVTNDNGCKNTKVDSVFISEPVKADFKVNDVCIGDSIRCIDNSSGGITEYSWSFGDGGVSTDADPSHFYSAVSDYSIFLIVENESGCTDNISRTVNVYSLPTVDLGPPEMDICSGDSMFMTVPEDFHAYFWNDGTTAQSHFIDPYSPGIYAVTVVDSNICKAFDSVEVRVIGLPDVDLGPDLDICFGQRETLDMSVEASDYFWNGVSGSRTLEVEVTGEYVAEAINEFGCSSEPDTVFISVVESPREDLISNTGTGFLTATEANSWQWMLNGVPLPGGEIQEIQPPESGTYEVLIKNLDGCWVTSNPFEVDISIPLESIPEGFSPNGDGVHDVFEIKSVEFYGQSEFSVFNRWGQMVFHERPYQGKWNGRSNNGTELPEGTYFYILQLNTEKQLSSYVVIFR